jgi:hypothetical protein
VLGSVQLQQDAIEAGDCPRRLRFAALHGDALTSLYVCNTTGCNSHAALMLLPPAAPRPTFLVSSTFTLQGYSMSTFGAAQRTQFTGVLAEQLGVLPAKVSITSVTASGAPPGSRRLLQDGVIIAFTVETLMPESISTSLVRVAASSGFLTALQQGGLSAVTGVVMTAAPTSVQVHSPAAANVNSSKEQPSKALAGLAVLVVLFPIAALAVWLRRSHRRTMASVAAADARPQLPRWRSVLATARDEGGLKRAPLPTAQSPRVAGCTTHMASPVSTAFVQKLSEGLVECRSAFWQDDWPHANICACTAHDACAALLARACTHCLRVVRG